MTAETVDGVGGGRPAGAASRPPRPDVEVVVIGAGAAGIAAARRLLALGRSVRVLEAGARLGGRAWTESEVLGAPFDHGASWIHVAERNPLTPLARSLGVTLRDERRRVRDILLAGDRPATPAERAAHDAACEAWEAAAETRDASGGPDIPLAEAVPRGGPWDATVSHWYSAIISGVEAERFSLHDYVRTGLDGENLQVAEGFGTLVARLGEGLPVTPGAPVARLRWDGAGMAAEGEWGALRAGAAIVTVSTGVLATGGLRFLPELPDAVQAAIAGLPQGLLSKIALRASGAGRLGLGPFARLGRQVAGPGDHPISWMLWPWDRDHAVGFIGGEAAWTLAREGPAAAEAFARAELARYVGPVEVARSFAPGAVVTRWAEDPLFLGAYSHARVGCHGARAALRDAALAGGRLRFAGEACHTRYAGTVGGAWSSGERAAEAVHAALG
ncbi:flavin monoamine oxidase family protein [Roseicella aquatilis]|uniref:Tryptophan 2-monooxygenase n=1 Tax=Roseicella aquatilis TaxID=2527868 RepID=A0A4R4DXG1_9PROT|nr:FAD-dependent oxidoreductase [Roseicella aquatilis]TCZ65540.1 FAD-dependent oxidoreductase [Roseicella aquatilis]